MIKIAEINSSNFGSTGNIMLNIASTARKHGYEVYTFHPAGRTQRTGIDGDFAFGNRYERFISSKINYVTGREGRGNLLGTLGLLRRLDRIQPDIIHFHNLHSNFVNLSMLMRYIRKHNIKVVWTLHDCWSFTGHCPYFDIVACEKWKTQCHHCEMYREYPCARIDTSKSEYHYKKKLFTGFPSLQVVTPSAWLADLVKQSYLKKFPVSVIYNGIVLTVFRPTVSDFRKQHNISDDTFIILGVAFGWGERKGLDRLIRLAGTLDRRFKIVLVGTNDQIDRELPPEILSIHRTQDQRQLAEIYTAADVFLNPTREDNFPTVNIEALACGTPVLSYGAGGSAEAFDEACGKIVSDETIAGVLEALYVKNFDQDACIQRSKDFDAEQKFTEYIRLYDSIVKSAEDTQHGENQ